MCFSLLHSGLGLGSEDMTLELAYRWSSIKEKKKKRLLFCSWGKKIFWEGTVRTEELNVLCFFLWERILHYTKILFCFNNSFQRENPSTDTAHSFVTHRCSNTVRAWLLLLVCQTPCPASHGLN